MFRLLTAFFFLLSAQCFSQQSLYYKLPGMMRKNIDYVPSTIVFKVKPEFRSLCNAESIAIPSLNAVLASLGKGRLEKMFPGQQPPREIKNKLGEEYADLS